MADVNYDELHSSSLEINETILNELDATKVANTSKSSLVQARRYADRLKTFLRERRLCDNIEALVPQTLNKFLRYYYHSLRGKNGAVLICFNCWLGKNVLIPFV